MKVLVPGKQQKGWASEYECTGDGNGGGGCGAKLLVEEDDMYQTSHTTYDGSTEYYDTFRCMACGCETDIDDFPRPDINRRRRNQGLSPLRTKPPKVNND